MISAVHGLFRTEGPAAVTFGRVEPREPVSSRTTLYRHWSGPSELVADAWSRLVPPEQRRRADDLRADLVDIFCRVRDAVESATMRRSLPTFLAAALDDPVIADLHAAFVPGPTPAHRRPARRARDAGAIDRDVDLDLLVDLLSGPLFYRQLLRHQPTADTDVAALVDAVLTIARPR